MMLDATAGNRMMWSYRKPRDVVFMDKETELINPPDVIGDFTCPPFRDNIFNCILFDPPHLIVRNRYGTPPPWYGNPKEKGNWYGWWTSKQSVLIAIYKAQKAFKRLTKRLCFKWYEDRDGIKLYKLLPFFRGWKIINQNTKYNERNYATHWITFVRTSR